jgi:Protein of unknown function (DUF3102)
MPSKRYRTGKSAHNFKNLTGQIIGTEIPAEIVQEIARLHQQILGHARNSLNDAIRIGEILTRVKSVLHHGEWLDWAKSFLTFSERTARNYMACYVRRDAFKTANISDLTKAYGLILSSNGSRSDQPQRLHESNFYTQCIRLTATLMGNINHEQKAHPVESWRREQWISMAASLEPVAEFYQKLKALLE